MLVINRLLARLSDALDRHFDRRWSLQSAPKAAKHALLRDLDLDQPGSKPFCRLVFGLEHFNVLLEVRLLLTTLSMVYNARIWGRCVRNPFLLVLLAATMVNALHDVVAERACDTSGPCSLNAADQL